MTMPGQPTAKDLASLAANVKGAQDKLRAAMADVAATKVTTPAAVPPTDKAKA